MIDCSVCGWRHTVPCGRDDCPHDATLTIPPASSSSLLQEITEVLAKGNSCPACEINELQRLLRLAHAEIEGLQREIEKQKLNEPIAAAALGSAARANARAEAAEARAEAAEGRFATAEDGRLSALRHCVRLEKQIQAREGTTPPTASPVRDAGEGEQAEGTRE